MVPQTAGLPAGHEPANLGDILERVLDRGLVIVGDIKVSLLDIELLTIKLRLLVASVETARELGIDWWEHDPWLVSSQRTSVSPDDRRRGEITAERRSTEPAVDHAVTPDRNTRPPVRAEADPPPVPESER